MAVEDRNLAVGTRLVAKYKKQNYTCDVVHTDEGVRYRLEDGRDFKSLSAAGSAVMHGTACKGWRFWTVSDAPKESAVEDHISQEQEPSKSNRSKKIIRRVANQQGTPQGSVRWFCSACGDSFFATADQAPEVCPKGHRADLDSNGDLVTQAVGSAASGDEPDID